MPPKMVLMLVLMVGLVVFSAVAVMVAGLLTLLRDSAKLQNRWFFAVTFSAGLWAVFNFAGSNVVDRTLTGVFVRLDFSIALLLGLSLLMFVATLVQKQENSVFLRILLSSKFIILAGFINLLLILGVATNLFFTISVASGELAIAFSPLFVPYALLLIVYLICACFLLLRRYMLAKRAEKQQLSLMVLGLVVAVLTNLATNLIFPEIFSERSTVIALNILGYLGLFFFVLCIYLAITLRHLFDIRLVLARSATYIFLLGLVAAFYVGALTLLSRVFFHEQSGDVQSITMGAIVTLFAALTFQYLRNIFSKVTNKLFFQEAYDPEEVIDQLNAITTSELDLNKLLNRSGTLIQEKLKVTHYIFMIFDRGNELRHTVGEQKEKIDYEQFAKEVIPALQTKYCVTVDDLSVIKVHTRMRQGTYDLLMPLYVNNVLIGCGLFGIKKDGTIYSSQDIRVLDTLAASLSLATQNALRFEEIQNFNVTLQDEVRKATQQLEKTNERLRLLDQTKDDFISMASHQMRTPLTSVKGYLSMVLEGDAGKVNPRQEKLLNQAFISSQRMVYLIADLLNVSRLRTGKFVIESTPVNLAEVIEGEVSQLKETAAARGLKLEYDKPKSFPTLMLDETKIRQVIMNFIDNAIYYTPSGGHIWVELQETEQSIELTVKDNGIGVPKHEQHHLFTKFFRADNAKKARPDGTGLGLFMAKKVIIAQGGSITFRSVEHKGSTFGFTFAKAHLQVSKDNGNPQPAVLKS